MATPNAEAHDVKITTIPQSTPNVPGQAPDPVPIAAPDPARHGWPVIDQRDNVTPANYPAPWSPQPTKENR